MLLAAGACRSFDEPLNFERSDAKQLKFERDFAAKERKESRKRARQVRGVAALSSTSDVEGKL